jgi:AraC-like DNA-binding protein
LTDANQFAPTVARGDNFAVPQAAPLPTGIPEFHFSTDRFPERDRMAAWQEIFGRTIVNVEFETACEGPVSMEASVRGLPGLGIVTSRVTDFGFNAIRTPALISNGGDDIIFTIMNKGACGATQFGRDVAVGGDAAFAAMSTEVGQMAVAPQSAYIVLRVPRPALAPMVPDLGAACVRPLDKATEPLRLLRHHLTALQDASAIWSADLQRLFVGHTYDLVAAVLGTTREAAEIANGRGLQAARLRAIKDDIVANLHRPDLTVAAIAMRQRITPRHVQRLFDMEGTTFSQFLREQKLAQAHRMLASPHFVDRSITTIAYDAGSGDLSHFNRAFRQFYGMTPSDVRSAARRENGR